MTERVDPWLLSLLLCPACRAPVREEGAWLACDRGCRYPVVDGVPVFLRKDRAASIDLTAASIRQAERAALGASPASPFDAPPYWVGSLGIDDAQRQGVLDLAQRAGGADRVDPVVAYLVSATNGIAYEGAVGLLGSLPIPELRLPPGEGRSLLDVGCSWGRWTASAAQLGYRVVGVDPSLGAVMAARRVARSLGVEALFVVGDARYLCFHDRAFDVVFSYSVLQHLSVDDATAAVEGMGRILARGGRALVQMPNKLGVRSLQHQARRRFREATGFEVRYWSVPDLLRLFERAVGPTRWSVDCFFGLGLQPTDLEFMTPVARAATRLSERLKRVAERIPTLRWAADSVYLDATRR